MRSLRSKFLIGALVPIAVFGLAMPALATGPVLPPTIPDTAENRFFYSMWFGDTNPDWVPRGEIVADSGFRPLPNGLPYANYGASLSDVHVFFGTPNNNLKPLDSFGMRSLYGDGVCQGPVTAQGTCDLTPAASYLSLAIFEAVTGVGHCVGFATVAAGLYNGQLEPDALAAFTLGSQSQLQPQVQQIIARNWATQWTTETTDFTPNEVLAQLRESLTPGSAPFTLVLDWESAEGGREGHAITPFAVYDRGNGLFDIGVYDNNYPFKKRAVQVDTNTNSWAYEALINPSAPATIARGDATTKSLQLMSVADSLAVQECLVCLGGRDTHLLLIDSMPTEAARNLQLNLLDSQGQPLPADRFLVLPALDSHNPELANPPAVDVDPGDGFIYALDASQVVEDFPLTVRSMAASGVNIAGVRSFPAGAQAQAQFDDLDSFAFGADVSIKPKMEHVFTQGIRHYTSVVYGGEMIAAENLRSIKVERPDTAIYFGDSDMAGGSMTVNVTLDRRGDSRKFRALKVAYPAGGQLVLDYSNWKRVNQRPTFGIDIDGDGSIDEPVRMRRVG